MARRLLPALALVVFLPLLGGCTTLFGQRYQNFTAYYNTFYNAQRTFDREERGILRADAPVDRTQYLSLHAQPRPESRTGFDTAIRKAADLLRDHPQSRWVDDALLLIGKSYHYQGNFTAAAQKFREVLALGESRLSDEATLWLGRSLMEAEAYAEAADVLRAGLDGQGVNDDTAAQMRLVLGEIDVRRGDLGAAAASLGGGLAGVRDRDAAARAAFLLGQVYEAQGSYDAAERAFDQAAGLRPRSAELLYAAQLQRALALSRQGRTEAALGVLQRLRRDDKFFQQRAEVELQRARVLAGSDRPDEARDLLLLLLYDRDSGLQIDAVRGRLHFRLAEVYRDGLGDYIRAAAHFDTAAVAMRRTAPPTRAVRYTADAIGDVEPLAQAFGSFARVQGRIVEMDSLLALGAMDDEAFAAAIAEIRAQRSREAAARDRDLRRIQDQQGFAGGAGRPPALGGAAGASPPLPGGGEQAGGAATGFLAYRDPIRVQEGLVAFEARWGRRPHVPNWRRSEAVSAELAVRDGLTEEGGVSSAPSLDLIRDMPVDVSAVPRTPEAQRRMREERAAAHYELGNVLFLSLDRPEEAVAWYAQVVEEDGELPVAVRAAYALAEAERALGRNQRAETLYAMIADRHPDHPLAAAAAEQLGRTLPELPPDDDALAEESYAYAYMTWQEGDPARAFEAMLEIAERYPHTDAGARATLASGLVYAEWAAGDTLALLAQSPDRLLARVSPSSAPPVLEEPSWLEEVYARVETEHPGSPYARRAQALREVLQEQRVALHAAPLFAAAPEPPAFPDVDLPEIELPEANQPEAALAEAELPEVERPAEGLTPPVAAAPPPSADTPLLSASGIDPSLGGRTWVVASEPSASAAEAVASSYRARGYRASVLPATVGGRVAYRVGVGQFATAAEAARHRRELPPDAPADAWLLSL